MKYPAVGVESVMLAPGALATTARTANLDCLGANYATIRVSLSAELNTNSTNVVLALLESDDTTATNFATFDATFNRTVDNTAAAVAVSHVNLIGRKRYLRISITPDTTTNGTVYSCANATLYKGVRSGTISDYGSVAVG